MLTYLCLVVLMMDIAVIASDDPVVDKRPSPTNKAFAKLPQGPLILIWNGLVEESQEGNGNPAPILNLQRSR